MILKILKIKILNFLFMFADKPRKRYFDPYKDKEVALYILNKKIRNRLGH